METRRAASGDVQQQRAQVGCGQLLELVDQGSLAAQAHHHRASRRWERQAWGGTAPGGGLLARAQRRGRVHGADGRVVEDVRREAFGGQPQGGDGRPGRRGLGPAADRHQADGRLVRGVHVEQAVHGVVSEAEHHARG